PPAAGLLAARSPPTLDSQRSTLNSPFRKASLLRLRPALQRDHFFRPTRRRRSQFDRQRLTRSSDYQRADFLCALSRDDDLAGATGRILSAAKGMASRAGSWRGHPARGAHRVLPVAGAKNPGFGHGLVLVPGNAGASDRFGPGRPTGSRRSLHLHSTDRT